MDLKMDSKRIDELYAVYNDGLLKDTVPFWLKYAIDEEYGGFLNYIDRDGSIIGTDKPVWILNRFTWLLSLLYNEIEKKEEWLRLAKHGIDFISKYCFDTDGRMFFELTREGKPLRKRRYVFSEAFGVLAYSEYALASGDEKALEKAKEIYKSLVNYHRNPGLLPAKGYPGTRDGKSHAMSMILLSASQQIRKTGKDAFYDEVIDSSLNEVFNDFMRYDEKAVLETVGCKGERLDCPEGRVVCPGHAIETAWFIMEEGRYRGDKSLIEKACLILDWSLAFGWDDEFGGIRYFTDVEGKPALQYEHDMKLWWPHNETIYATLLAYYLTGDEKYAKWHEKVHDYAYSHFPDKEYGEWFKYLHRDGTISTSVKGNGWAGPFHLPRMQFNCSKLLKEMKEKKDT